ncbi:hypothetical protein Arth_1359 [Arthrobacter sp. FB24]|uniref:helix-turn-helix domain-containing protein n=1 Tax=Arthrobacter sp. (strain FB24) TaxID=290399 RepID=UPI0000E5D5B2|nr:helix-turn-helix domain-containing protein [Arthrobacter sp. FB24]ABK02753.1 hypothetical protein Arth_1359 [Arthrobacter sp. FB24]
MSLDPLALYTADEAAARLKQVPAATIRRLAKQGRIEYVKGARGKVLLTEAQILALVDHLTQPTRPQIREPALPDGIDSLTSSLSRSRAGHH